MAIHEGLATAVHEGLATAVHEGLAEVPDSEDEPLSSSPVTADVEHHTREDATHDDCEHLASKNGASCPISPRANAQVDVDAEDASEHSSSFVSGPELSPYSKQEPAVEQNAQRNAAGTEPDLRLEHNLYHSSPSLSPAKEGPEKYHHYLGSDVEVNPALDLSELVSELLPEPAADHILQDSFIESIVHERCEETVHSVSSANSPVSPELGSTATLHLLSPNDMISSMTSLSEGANISQITASTEDLNSPLLPSVGLQGQTVQGKEYAAKAWVVQLRVMPIKPDTASHDSASKNRLVSTTDLSGNGKSQKTDVLYDIADNKPDLVSEYTATEGQANEARVQMHDQRTLRVTDIPTQHDEGDYRSLPAGQHPSVQSPSTNFTSGKRPAPAKTSQEITLSELKAQRTALIASLATLPSVQDLIAEAGSSDTLVQNADLEPAEADIVAAAQKIVKKHIKLLHEYNEIKDIGQGLMGLIADQRGARIVEVQEEFGIDSKD